MNLMATARKPSRTTAVMKTGRWRRTCTGLISTRSTMSRLAEMCTPLRVRIMTQSAALKTLDTSVRKLSRILSEDVRMTGTRNDDRLDAQDPTRRRLLPLWPDLVVSRARNVHGVDLRQRF